MESLRTGDHAGGGDGSLTAEQVAAGGMQGKACAAERAAPAGRGGVERHWTCDGRVGMSCPPVISMPADAAGRVTA